MVEVIDRSPGAVELYPQSRFGIDSRGYYRYLQDRPNSYPGAVVKGGSFSLYTRVWMGVWPPRRSEPGYCAVVGEQWDGKFSSRDRPYTLLDEGVGLETGPSEALLPDLFDAVCALKDIYKVDSIYVPPNEPQFLSDLQRTRWGICSYPPEDEVSERELREVHPFFVSRGRIGPPIEAPYADDEEQVFRTMQALLSRNKIQVNQVCQIFLEDRYRAPFLASALATNAMQSVDWNERLGDQIDYDGYPMEPPTEEEEEHREDWMIYLQDLVEAHSDSTTRERLAQGGWASFVQPRGGWDDPELAGFLDDE